jgi:SAM-dependent methyltransferase
MSSPVTSYDELWRGAWGDMQHAGPVHRHIRDDMLRTVRALNVRSVLDGGCGSGENLAALAAIGPYELTGVDVSSEALARARQRLPAARFQVLDVQREALPERFDLVMSIQVVEHLLDDIAALRNMAAMTGRFACISTMQGRMRPSELAIGHVRNYSAVELHRKLEAAGLRPVKTYGWGFPFYSPLYRSAVEWLPGGPPGGPMGPLSRALAGMLYHLYRLNWPGRGDVLTVLAQPATAPAVP